MKRERPKAEGWTVEADAADGWHLRHKGGLFVVASYGNGWDHVSVSQRSRCPTWEEMCLVKDLLFSPDELVIQYHPAKKDYISLHPYTLHMWRPQGERVPMPPKILV